MNRMRELSVIGVMMALSLTAACGGGEHNQISHASQYPKGQMKIEDQLKFDARVLDSEIDEDKLIVNVSQEWVASPPGMKERSLGQWYNMWREAQGVEEGRQRKGLEVIVRHEGDDVAKWSSDKGYQMITPKSEKGSES